MFAGNDDTAAGVIECGRGPVALCVMTRGNQDRRYHPDNAGNRLCADVARAVYDHFRARDGDKKPGEKAAG